jgi:hypothetical protein
MKTEDKIISYLQEQSDEIDINTDTAEYVSDEDLLEKMFDFITSLDPNKLSDEQAQELVNIVDHLSEKPEEEIQEIKRVRISPAEKRKRRALYRKNKQKILAKARRYRKTSSYKKYKKKAKRMSRTGKTSTGKMIRKFI